MPNHVCLGATLNCTMGLGPSQLVVLPLHRTMTGQRPAANITDHQPFINIVPFPMCQAPANPIVAAATAAKLGVPTPAACMPDTPSPWVAGSSTVSLDNQPALNKSSTLTCMYGGLITIAAEGQPTHQIP